MDSESTFAGLPVVTVPADTEGVEFPPVGGPVAWRYAVEYEVGERADDTELLPAWVAAMPGRPTQTALVIGPWSNAWEAALPLYELIDALDEMPALRHLSVGDMSFEECEISWINQDDYTPIANAAGDRLETLHLRGGNGLSLPTRTWPALRELRIETGGLDDQVVAAIAGSTFPVLERLTLWLGAESYGATVTTDTLTRLLHSEGLPALTHLALANSEESESQWPLIAASPLLPRLRSLDLSMSTAGDELAPLLTHAAFGHLAELDISECWFTDAGTRQVTRELPSTKVHTHSQNSDSEYGRYVTVSE